MIIIKVRIKDPTGDGSASSGNASGSGSSASKLINQIWDKIMGLVKQAYGGFLDLMGLSLDKNGLHESSSGSNGNNNTVIDDQQREVIESLENMDLKQLREFYNKFTQEHPDVTIPEELKQELNKNDEDVDVDSVRKALIALQMQVASTDPDIAIKDLAAARKYIEEKVDKPGFGNNGCTQFVKEYLLKAKSKLGSYMENGSPIQVQLNQAEQACDPDDRGNASLMWTPTLEQWAKQQKHWKDVGMGSNEGDIVITENGGHSIIADGKGGAWGNSSSAGKILHYDSLKDTYGDTTRGFVTTGVHGTSKYGMSKISSEEAELDKALLKQAKGEEETNSIRGLLSDIKKDFKVASKDTKGKSKHSTESNKQIKQATSKYGMGLTDPPWGSGYEPEAGLDDDKVKFSWAWLTDPNKGKFTKEQAAGIIGNMRNERTSFYPQAYERDVLNKRKDGGPHFFTATDIDDAVNDENQNSDLDNNIGIFCYSNTNIDSLGKWAKARNANPLTMTGQFEFGMSEDSDGYKPSVIPMIRKTSTVEDASHTFGKYFEVFGGSENDDNSEYTDRETSSKEVYEHYKDKKDPTGDGSASSGNASGSGSSASKLINQIWDKIMTQVKRVYGGFLDLMGLSLDKNGLHESSSGSNGNNNTSGGTTTTSEKLNNVSTDGSAAAAMENYLGVKINSPYGVNRGDHIHNGDDFPVEVGTKVATPVDGVVDDAPGEQPDGYGNYVVIKDSKGYYHIFAHLSDNTLVKANQKVEAGHVIGLSGGEENAPGSGSSTGPHLHYSVFDSSHKACAGFPGSVNPETYEIGELVAKESTKNATSKYGIRKYGLGSDIDLLPSSDAKNLFPKLDFKTRTLSYNNDQNKATITDTPSLVAAGISADMAQDTVTRDQIIESKEFQQALEKAKQSPPPVTPAPIIVEQNPQSRSRLALKSYETSEGRRNFEREDLNRVAFGMSKDEEDFDLLKNNKIQKPELRNKEDMDSSGTFGITDKETDSLDSIFGQFKYGMGINWTDPFGRISIPKISRVEDPFRKDKDEFERNRRNLDQEIRSAANRGRRLGRFDIDYSNIPIMSPGLPGSDSNRRMTLTDLPRQIPNISNKPQSRPTPHLNEFPWQEIRSDEALNKELGKMGISTLDKAITSKPIERPTETKKSTNIVGQLIENAIQMGKDFLSRINKSTPISKTVAIALSTDDEQEATTFIEKMSLQELKEFYKHFTQEHPNITIPEELKQELNKSDTEIDIELVRAKLLVLKLQSIPNKDETLETTDTTRLYLTDEMINKMSDQELVSIYERIKNKYDLPYWLKFDYENDSTNILRAKLRVINRKYIQPEIKANNTDQLDIPSTPEPGAMVSTPEPSNVIAQAIEDSKTYKTEVTTPSADDTNKKTEAKPDSQTQIIEINNKNKKMADAFGTVLGVGTTDTWKNTSITEPNEEENKQPSQIETIRRQIEIDNQIPTPTSSDKTAKDMKQPSQLEVTNKKIEEDNKPMTAADRSKSLKDAATKAHIQFQVREIAGIDLHDNKIYSMSDKEIDAIYNKIADVYDIPEDKKFNENDDLDTKRNKLRDIRDLVIATGKVKDVEKYNADKGKSTITTKATGQQESDIQLSDEDIDKMTAEELLSAYEKIKDKYDIPDELKLSKDDDLDTLKIKFKEINKRFIRPAKAATQTDTSETNKKTNTVTDFIKSILGPAVGDKFGSLIDKYITGSNDKGQTDQTQIVEINNKNKKMADAFGTVLGAGTTDTWKTNIEIPTKKDQPAPLQEAYDKIEKDNQTTTNIPITKKPSDEAETVESASELVNKALTIEDEQERRQLIEQMNLQELEEYYKLFKEKYPNAEIPEGIEEDFANQDIDSVRIKLAAAKLNKEGKINTATTLSADTEQIQQTIQSQIDKNTKLEEETRKEIEARPAAEPNTSMTQIASEPKTATASSAVPNDQIGREILAAQNKTNELLSQILAAILNKAEEVTTAKSTASTNDTNGTNTNTKNPTNSKAPEMVSNIIGGMKNILNLFTTKTPVGV